MIASLFFLAGRAELRHHFRMPPLRPRPFFQILLLSALVALAGTGCGSKNGGSADGAAPPPPARAPKVPDSVASKITLILSGGPFRPEEPLVFALSGENARFGFLPDGLRIAVSAPEKQNNLEAHDWGFWLFADGPIEEEAILATRTGTMLIHDRIAYSPAVVPGSKPGATNHTLDARLEILRHEPDRGIFEAEWTARLLASDGRTEVKATAEIVVVSGKP